MLMKSLPELRLPITGVLIIDGVEGMRKLDIERKYQLPVSLKLAQGDKFRPGEPYYIAKSVAGRIPLKPLRVPGVCVYEGCAQKLATKKAKWCDTHFEEARRIAMLVNKRAFDLRHRKKPTRKQTRKPNQRKSA